MADPRESLYRELGQYMASITAYYPENQFKAMLYNLAPNPDLASSLQQNKFQIRADNPSMCYAVDPNLFAEALSKNPDPSRLYPCQINSCTQLCERVKGDVGASGAFNGVLETSKQTLRELDQDLTTLSSEKMNQLVAGQARLLARMCTISFKVEQLLEARNALTRDPEMELKLRARIEALNKKLEVARKISELKVPEVEYQELKVPEKSLPDVITVLREQRNNIAKLRKTVVEDAERIKKLETHLASRRDLAYN